MLLVVNVEEEGEIIFKTNNETPTDQCKGDKNVYEKCTLFECQFI